MAPPVDAKPLSAFVIDEVFFVTIFAVELAAENPLHRCPSQFSTSVLSRVRVTPACTMAVPPSLNVNSGIFFKVRF